MSLLLKLLAYVGLVLFLALFFKSFALGVAIGVVGTSLLSGAWYLLTR